MQNDNSRKKQCEVYQYYDSRLTQYGTVKLRYSSQTKLFDSMVHPLSKQFNFIYWGRMLCNLMNYRCVASGNFHSI